MIAFPELETAQQDLLYPSFFGKIQYSFTQNTFVFPNVTPRHAFFPPKTVPPPHKHFVKYCEASEEAFVIGKTHKNFRVISGDYAYKFALDSSAHSVKLLRNQVFYATDTKLFSTCQGKMQSLTIPSINMDVTDLTNDIILLQNGFVKIVNGPSYRLGQVDFKYISFGDHPKTAYIFSEKGGFFVDFRVKKPKQVCGSNAKIREIIKNDSYLLIRTFLSVTVIDKRMDNKNMYTMPVDVQANIKCNDEYIVTRKDVTFGYYKLNNPNENETQRYDLHDLVAFATYRDKYYYFRRKKIEEYGVDKRTVFYYCPIVETWFKHADVEFFEKEVVGNVRCNDYFEIDDLQSEKYDKIVEGIRNYGMEEKIVNDQTATMKKVKRVGGF